MKNKHNISAIISILTLLLNIANVTAQEKYWTSFNAINDSLTANPKPIMVFIHTDWCKYCEMQEQTAFADTILVKKLCQKHYCLQLNAESKRNLQLLNHSFPASSSGYHSLATAIGTSTKQETLSLPTTVFLDPSLNILYRNNGLMTKKQLLQMCK